MPRAILVSALGNRERVRGQDVLEDGMRKDPVVGAQQIVVVSFVHAERYRVEGALRRIGDLLMVCLRLGGVGGGGGGRRRRRGRGRGGRGGQDDQEGPIRPTRRPRRPKTAPIAATTCQLYVVPYCCRTAESTISHAQREEAPKKKPLRSPEKRPPRGSLQDRRPQEASDHTPSPTKRPRN